MFHLNVEAGYGSQLVVSRLPSKGGNLILSFLMGLGSYCLTNTDEQVVPDEYFKQFHTCIGQPVCEIFKPIMDCIWSDANEIGGTYLEDEYEWYAKRNSDPTYRISENEFQQIIIDGSKCWQSIDAVIVNVKDLIDVFKISRLVDKDGFYTSEDLLLYFEALQDTLTIFKHANYEVVRLNFI